MTTSALARRWKTATTAPAGADMIPRREAGATPPLSFAQERMWFLDQYAPGSSAYTVWLAVHIRETIDPDLLAAALTAVAARHESLRMRFPMVDGAPVVEVDDPVPASMQRLQAPDLDTATSLVAELVQCPFDLAGAPPWRAALITIGRDEHVFCLPAHHIIVDGWSTDLILRELLAAYDAAAGGAAQLLPRPQLGFGDVAAWQRGRAAITTGRDLRYWRQQLAGVPPLELPTDRPYPAVQSTSGASLTFRIDARLTADLRALAAAGGATDFMVLLAAFHALLGWYCGQDDFAVGCPSAGRWQPQTEDIVGMFVNTLVMRADLAGDPSFGALLGRVRGTVLEAFAHQELPFEQLVGELKLARDTRRTPIFQVGFALQNYATGRPPGGHRVEILPVPATTTRHELAFYLGPDPGPGGDELVGTVTYVTDLFDAVTVAALVERYLTLLRQVAAEPATRLSQLDLLTGVERTRLLGWGAAGAHRIEPVWQRLDQPLRFWAARTPHAPAVHHGGQELTYQQLLGRAWLVATRLRAGGLAADDLVGICLEQSVELAVAILGVVLAGGAYLPLDPQSPPARIVALLSDSGTRTVLTSADLVDRLSGYPGTVIVGETSGRETSGRETVGRETSSGGETSGRETAGREIREADRSGGGVPSPDDLAYVIYTSGSTGRPKGVAVPHRQVLRYLDGVRQRLGIVEGARFALLQSLAFDFGVTMFHLALYTGGCVHLVPRRISGADLAGYLADHAIDYIKLTPSHLTALATDIEPAALLPRRALLLGGEGSSAAFARQLAGYGRATIVNHYGPTESTVGVTTYQVPAGGEAPAGGVTPIGRPLPASSAYVLDGWLRPRPIGLPGELFLGGGQLARGYLGSPALTARAFLPDPFGEPGARMYRTGDQARWLPDGTLEFLGRNDDQVKIRGYRVEPAEIEAALAACPGVGRAYARVRDGRVIAYLEPPHPTDAMPPHPADAMPSCSADAPPPTGSSARPDDGELRRRLAETLPEYMIPAAVVWVDRFPLQSHGKIDRAALPDPVFEGQAAAYVTPHGPVQQVIAAVWADLLGVDRVGAADNFFDLGGHSLLAIGVVSRLRRELPAGTRAATVLDLFQHPTVEQLAEALAAGSSSTTTLLYELTRAGGPAQRRLSLVCVPYGGASAVVYQPLADALPAGTALYAVAVPGHELGDHPAGVDQQPIEEVADRCVQEILARVDGPLVLYGHCGPGAALAVAIALGLNAAGRRIEAVYLGGIFPFARPEGLFGRVSRALRMQRLRSETVDATWLQAMGADVGGLEPEERRHMIRAMRRDAELAESFFTELLAAQAPPLAAPVISVIGERDPGTEYYQERYREWEFLSPRTALVVLDEAGHYFLRYRAAELASIVTRVHPALAGGVATAALPTSDDDQATWWLHAASAADASAAVAPNASQAPVAGIADESAARAAGRTAGPRPSLRRFLAVAAGQLVSMTGTALTEFAIPVWAYLDSGSLLRFALFAVVSVLPGILVAPVAGALVDRIDRRRVMLAASIAAGSVQATLAVLVVAHILPIAGLYGLLCVLSVALTFQRLSYTSAVAQLAPKHYLGHANGVVQLATGTAQFLVPLAAVALLHAVGMAGILAIDVASYVVAVVVLALVRFPATMAWRRREPLGTEIRAGFGYFWGRPGLRAMLLFFVALNVFLATVQVLISPLVLNVGTLRDAGEVALVSGGGAVVGGLVMALWGGPRRRRMQGMLLSVLGFAASAAVVGARPLLPAIAAGAFGMSLTLVVMNGIWITIVHTKTPQRFHARVIALNQMVALSVLSLGYLLAPVAGAALEPALMPNGTLAGSLGRIVGTGPGRGIGVLYLACALVMAVLAIVALRRTRLATFDRDVPDAEPDDAVGLAALADRGRPVAATRAAHAARSAHATMPADGGRTDPREPS